MDPIEEISFFCYNKTMSKDQSLFDANFSGKPEKYRQSLVNAVLTSTAIEIGSVPKEWIEEVKKYSHNLKEIN